MAEVLLHPSSVSEDLLLAVPNVEHASIAVRPMLTPVGYEPYVRMFADVVEAG
jgi:hypothetical protein